MIFNNKNTLKKQSEILSQLFFVKKKIQMHQIVHYLYIDTNKCKKKNEIHIRNKLGFFFIRNTLAKFPLIFYRKKSKRDQIVQDIVHIY